MVDPMSDESTHDQTLEVAGARKIVLRRGEGQDALELLERDGRMSLNVSITEQGVTLSIHGASLELSLERELTINAESIALHGRSSVALATEGTLSSVARSVRVETTHGNIELEANDDVRVDGERVLLNCPRPSSR
jgi:hypothetical protein